MTITPMPSILIPRLDPLTVSVSWPACGRRLDAWVRDLENLCGMVTPARRDVFEISLYTNKRHVWWNRRYEIVLSLHTRIDERVRPRRRYEWAFGQHLRETNLSTN